MPFQGDELYRTQDQIVAAMIAAYQSAIPDIWIAEDGTLRIVLEIEAGQIEGLYLSNQLALEDMFIQTASMDGLGRAGEQYGVPQIQGTPSVGKLLFTGSGGTYIPVGTEVGFDPGGGADVLYFVNIQDGSLPAPGIPTALTAADDVVVGALTGTFEYAISFLTTSGETLIGAISNAIILASSKMALSNIPLGGPGTIGRKIYRSNDGINFGLVTTINDNTTTVYVDNVASTTSAPLATSTAEQLLLNAQSEQNAQDYNAVANSITILANAPDGLTSVTNPQLFSGGSDIEAIDVYRERLLNWIRSPQTGAPQDLVNWALTVPGVSSATNYPNDNLGVPTPGHSTTRISGPAGTIPGADVVAATLALLQSKTLGSIAIHVGTFTPTTENITITIYPDAGYTTAGLTPSVQAAIANYINSINVGGTMYLSSIVSAVVALAGVLDATVTSPGGNVTAVSTNKLISGTIVVNGTP